MHTSSLAIFIVLLATLFANTIKTSEEEEDYFTVPPKTKECIERELTMQVILAYKHVLEMTEDLFAVTKAQADNFKDLVTKHEQKRDPPVPPCKRILPRFAQCKFDEVAHILNTTTCQPQEGRKPQQGRKPQVGRNFRTTMEPQRDEESSEEGSDQPEEDFDYDDEVAEGGREDQRTRRDTNQRTKRSVDTIDDANKILSRNRRALAPKQIYRLADGTVTEIRDCYNPGSGTENGHLRMTKVCTATTTLPENRFPRYLNEVLCAETDNGCVKNDGLSVQRVIIVKFRADYNNTLGIGKLGNWTTYEQNIRTSCNCQIKKDTFIATLL